MKTTLLFLSVFLSVSLFGQTEIFTTDNQIIGVEYFIGKTENQLYFVQSGSLETYKIDLSRIKMDESVKSTLNDVDLLESNSTLASSLLKFSKQSTTGIVISTISSISSIIVPFITTSTPALVISPAIGIVGFIVWATSYKHLKTGAQFSLAKDYE